MADDEVLVPVLNTADAHVTAAWYERMGFEVVGEHRFAPDLPLYVFLERGGVHLHLSEHSGDARPDTLVYFYVTDVEAIAEEYGVEVKNQPWAREIELTDPDGNRLRIGTIHTTELG
jgi:catechol 2,3-dioxygenase-like lactoylglutathione lyase family enzyme